MQLEGIVQNGVVVLPEGQTLPEGARVKIVVDANEEAQKPIGKSLLELAGLVKEWPSDMSKNHAHYLHGAPLQ